MNFLSPWNLLWLAPLAGGIIALWMLRLKRQEVTVSSLYLWQALLKETQANTPFQKLRRCLLLFLQLLAAFLLIFAFAKPFVYGQGLTGRTLVLVLDTSASMNATDVSPSRLAAAKAAADQYIDREMNGSDVAMVMAASSKPNTRIGFTTDKARLKAIIESTPATDTVADMPAALTLAQSLVGSRSGAQIRIFSDGAYASEDTKKIQALSFGNADVRLISVGSPAPDNVAITAMDGRRNPVTGNYEVFVNVQNLGSRQHENGTLSLLKDGKLIDARALTLPGGGQSETFDSPLLKTGGLITARLDDLTDDLAADNQATLVLPAPRQRKVLLVTQGNLFLERGLNLDPDVTLEECSPQEFATVGKSGAGYGMVVFDSALPDTPLPPGNYLLFNASNAQTPLAASGSNADTPAFIDQSQTHPIMRFVSLEGLHLRKAQQTALATWGQELAEADSGPLIAVGEHDGLRMISVAFDLTDSDWPLRVSFPIFLTNAVNWLTAAGGLGANSSDTPTGGVASVTVPAGLSSITIQRPDRSTVALTAPPDGGIVVYDGTEHVGLYHALASGSYDQPFTVNLLNRDESMLAPQNHPELNHAGTGGKPTASAPLAQRAKNDLWPIVAAIALLFISLEWLVFHRRL